MRCHFQLKKVVFEQGYHRIRINLLAAFVDLYPFCSIVYVVEDLGLTSGLLEAHPISSVSRRVPKGVK